MNKINLLDAAILFEKICSDIETQDEVNEELKRQFSEAQDLTMDQVDRRIEFMLYVEAQRDKAKDMATRWTARAKALEGTMEWIKNQAKTVLMAVPGVPLKGSLGAFKLVKNSKAALVTRCQTAKFSFEIVPDTDGIDPDYLKTMQFTVLDKDRIRSDLAAGKDVPFASLFQDYHVRFSLETK